MNRNFIDGMLSVGNLTYRTNQPRTLTLSNSFYGVRKSFHQTGNSIRNSINEITRKSKSEACVNAPQFV